MGGFTGDSRGFMRIHGGFMINGLVEYAMIHNICDKLPVDSSATDNPFILLNGIKSHALGHSVFRHFA